MNFSLMKVGTRLGAGFALVILAGLVVAVLGVLQLNNIKDSTTLLVEDRMVKVSKLGQVLFNVNLMTRAVRDIALLDDPKQQEQEKQRIDAAHASNDVLYKEFAATFSSAQGQQALQKIEQARTAFLAAIDKAAQLGLEGQRAMASDTLMREVRPVQASYFAALQEMTQLQEGFMQSTAAQVQDTVRATTLLMALIAGLAATAGALIAWLLTRSLTRQLGGEPDCAAGVARAIAAGNLAVAVPLRAGDTTSMLAILGAMRDSLVQVVARVRQGSESVASASTQIAQGNQDLSGRTEEQASSLEETAASMEQLGSTVSQNADNARQANQLAQSASTVAVQGGEVVAQVVDTMRGINEASRRIADIIQVIDSIAFQTNILALNAAVEAARAGEQGRGFAVVASEVRNLAQRSAEAAKEIKTLITDSVQRVEQGTHLVDRAGTTMDEVVTSIRRVTDIMGEISAASNEQSQGVLQVGEAVQQMDQVTQQNAALVEEMAAAASSLNHQAQDLVQAVGVFQLPQDGARVSAPAVQARAAASAVVGKPRPAAASPAAAAPKMAVKAARPGATAVPARGKPASAAAAPAALAAPSNNDDWESF